MGRGQAGRSQPLRSRPAEGARARAAGAVRARVLWAAGAGCQQPWASRATPGRGGLAVPPATLACSNHRHVKKKSTLIFGVSLGPNQAFKSLQKKGESERCSGNQCTHSGEGGKRFIRSPGRLRAIAMVTRVE